MTHTSWLLAAIVLLSYCDRVWAVSGPNLGSASGAGPNQADVETLPAGPAERVESTPHDASPVQAADSWRYRWYQGRWWYYQTDERWAYWDGQSWRDAAPAPQPAFPALQGNAAFVPNSPGVVQRRVPPPYRWLPRREGESDGRYMGRLARWNSPYANGFLQFSSPPPAYYGYGFGYGSMNPYAGYRPW